MAIVKLLGGVVVGMRSEEKDMFDQIQPEDIDHTLLTFGEKGEGTGSGQDQCQG